MAYMETINLVVGDTKPELNFTLRDSNTAAEGTTLDPDDPTTWDPVDLTGQTIKVKFRALGGATLLDTMTCGIHQPPTDGECFMQWHSTTLQVPAGTYEGEIELEDSSGRKQTVFDKLKFKIRDVF